MNNFTYGEQSRIPTTTFGDGMTQETVAETFDQTVLRSCDANINDPGSSALALLRPVAGDDSPATGLVASGELAHTTEDSADDEPMASSGIDSMNVSGLRTPGGPRMTTPITSGSTTNPPGSQGLGTSAYMTIPVKIGGDHA